MARINYDQRTSTAFKTVREVPREGLKQWREALQRHLDPTPSMTIVDIGAGTGAFATAFAEWFGVEVVAVEPSAAMRTQIPARPNIQVRDGHAAAIPLPDSSADAAWLSTVIHHIPDLHAAAREIRRVLRAGSPVLIRQAFPGRSDRIELIRWFPEAARTIDTYPSVEQTRQAFANAGFHQNTLEQIPQTDLTSLTELLNRIEIFRDADTAMRNLTDEEFNRGKQRLRDAVSQTGPAALKPRPSWLDLMVLR